MSPIAEVAVTVLKRQYPHVDGITDWRAQQTIQLLWERIFSLEERLRAAEATITTLVEATNTQEAAIESVSLQAQEALALSQRVGQAAESDTGGGGGGELPNGGDGGQAQEGVNAGLPTGHDSGGLLTALRAGQIIGGTANEWIALRNPTATVAERETNAVELLRRMIWHLQQAGFTAGRQQNPSGLLSRDKLAVEVDSVVRAYDVFLAFDDNTIQMGVYAGEVPSPNLVPDAGIAD